MNKPENQFKKKTTKTKILKPKLDQKSNSYKFHRSRTLGMVNKMLRKKIIKGKYKETNKEEKILKMKKLTNTN